MTALAAWQNFQVIMGSSAGALVGLQFVVLSLIASQRNATVDPQAGSAFATPTIIHFSTVLALAGILSAPWDGMNAPAIVCGLVGLAGISYAILITRRMHRQTAYRPEFEDWLFHVLLPFAAYLTLAASAYIAVRDARDALFGIAGAELLLLFIGIHSALDAVTYHVYVKRSEKQNGLE